MIAPCVAANALAIPATLLFARLMLILPYWTGGLSKLFDLPGALATMARLGLHPAWAFASLVILVEIVGPLLVVTDRWTWLGAGILGVFTVLEAFVAHRFWHSDDSSYGEQLRSFLEHIALAAAFIFVAAGSVSHARDERP